MNQPTQGDNNQTQSERIDPSDENGLRRWQEKFGVTAEQLQEAVQAVGGDPDAVREHLLNQGSSAGAS